MNVEMSNNVNHRYSSGAQGPEYTSRGARTTLMSRAACVTKEYITTFAIGLNNGRVGVIITPRLLILGRCDVARQQLLPITYYPR